MSLEQQFNSWQVLGTTVLGSAASSTSIITIPARDLIRITVIITGYGSGGDIASLRFGGTAGAVDSGNNYATAHGEWNAANKGNQDTLGENNSTSFLRLSPTSTNNGRQVTVNITNPTSTRKIVSIVTSTEQGSASTTPRRTTTGNGLWSNTTQQIISVQLITAGGANLNAGTGFVIEGINLT